VLRHRAQPPGDHSLGQQHTVERERQEPIRKDEVRRRVPSPGPRGPEGGYGHDGRGLHYDFERYEKFLPREHIIRYEDLCESNGKALSVIVPAAADLDEPLENKNANPLYDREKVLSVGERLLASEGAYWNFYSKEDVQEIMDELS
jgi:hypothetical protein